MALIGKNIRRFVANRNDIEAAEAMMTGSLFAGIAFSFARLGNVHAMSHPVSAFFDVPHGVANAVLLPVIAEYNALADHGKYLTIYNDISPIPAYADEFEPMMLVDAIRELCTDIGIPENLTIAINNASKNGTDRKQDRADGCRCHEERQHCCQSKGFTPVRYRDAVSQGTVKLIKYNM